MDRVYTALSSRITRCLEGRGLLYVQRVPREDRFSRSWPEMFGTSETEKIETACHQLGLSTSWLEGGVLELRNEGEVAFNHPRISRRVWCNACHLFHDSWSFEFWRLGRLGTSLRMKVQELGRQGRLKGSRGVNCYFADGTPIPVGLVITIRRVLWESSIPVPLQRGDVLLLDNHLKGHWSDAVPRWALPAPRGTDRPRPVICITIYPLFLHRYLSPCYSPYAVPMTRLSRATSTTAGVTAGDSFAGDRTVRSNKAPASWRRLSRRLLI